MYHKIQVTLIGKLISSHFAFSYGRVFKVQLHL